MLTENALTGVERVIMREFVKGLLCLIILAGVVATILSWSGRPTAETSLLRVSAPVVTAGAFLLFLLIHFRRDAAPDLLRQVAGNYLDRDGFCFAFQASAQNGFCVVTVFFQNRFERSCTATIALRSAKGFLLQRSAIDTFGCNIDCGPGAFGRATFRIAVPAVLQGTSQTFEAGASVEYPNGKGRRLRYRDGISLRSNSNFRNAFGTALSLAGAAAGLIVFSSPAKVTLSLPSAVATTVPGASVPLVETLWRLGDPTPVRE